MSEEVSIHPSSIVHPEAKFGKNCKVGPFCEIGPNVELGDDCTVHAHVVLDGVLKVGNRNQFYQFCSIGSPPQDLTYNNEPTVVEIGEGNIFREYVSIHRGTMKQDQVTKVGSNNLLMAYVHLGHDVVLGSNVTIANSVNLAGHVRVGDRCIIGGATSISQFVQLGNGSYVGGGSGVDRDIPHFCTAYGNRVRLKGVNIIGMRRQGFQKSEISEVVDFFRTMEASGLSPRAFIDHEEFMSEYKNSSVIKNMSDFIQKSEVGIAPFIS